MDRLAIYGWTDSTPVLLAALRAAARLEPSAVGDERSAVLVRARAELGIPGFQHVREMARVSEFDAALIGAVGGAADIAEIAAKRGADLLLYGPAADGETLSRAAAAASRYGVALAVLRPWLRTPGLSALTAHLAAAPCDLLLVEAAENRPPMALLRDLVALATRIAGVELRDVAASTAGPATDPAAIAVQIRLAGDRVASITARRGVESTLRLVASNADSAVMLRREDGATVIQAQGASAVAAETLSHEDVDQLYVEAKRVPEVRAGGGADAVLAAGEGAILATIERVLEHGFAEHLEEHPRPALRLLRGGGHSTPAAATPAGRRGGLSLVSR
jgi:hypothetical protein